MMLKDFLRDHHKYCNSGSSESGSPTTVRYLLDEELRNNGQRDEIITGNEHSTPRVCKLLDTVLKIMKICSFPSFSTTSSSFTTPPTDHKYASRCFFPRTLSWNHLRRGFLMKQRGHRHPNWTNVQNRVNRNVCSSDRMLIRDIISLGSFTTDGAKNFSCSRWSEIHSSTTSSGSDTGPSIYSPLPTSDMISDATTEATANYRCFHKPKPPNNSFWNQVEEDQVVGLAIGLLENLDSTGILNSDNLSDCSRRMFLEFFIQGLWTHKTAPHAYTLQVDDRMVEEALICAANDWIQGSRIASVDNHGMELPIREVDMNVDIDGRWRCFHLDHGADIMAIELEKAVFTDLINELLDGFCDHYKRYS